MAKRFNPLAVANARRKYEGFTGEKPTRAYVADLDDRDRAGYRLGQMVGVAYEARRDGKTDQYFHRFAKKARPDLVVRSDGKQIYAIGGDYHVTDRGIEDMPSMFVVNPSPRKRKRKGSRRGRTSTGQFKKNPSKRRSPPVAKARRRRARRTYRRNPAPALMRRNPIRRRRRSRGRVSLRRYRRNPIRLSSGGKGGISLGNMLMPGLMVGAGAVGTELLMGYLPLPAMLKTGPQRYLTKGVISVAAGYMIAKYANRKFGEAFAMGGIVIAAHDALKSVIVQTMPSAKFGGYNWDKYGYNSPSLGSMRSPGIGYYSPGQTMPAGSGMGEYMGEYMNASAF